MTKKIIFSLLILVLVLMPVLSGCESDSPATSQTANQSTSTKTQQPVNTTTSSTSASSTTAVASNWYDKWGAPQYGGDIILRVTSLPTNFDPNLLYGGAWHFWSETLFFPDWLTDRATWSFKTGFTPINYRSGLLVKDWEMPDSTTIKLTLRENVVWQDKSPVNGRKFTAADVKNHYDRVMGIGAYTAPSAFYANNIKNIESVTASNDYTVIFKFKSPGLSNLLNIADLNAFNYIEAKESIELEPQGIKNWKNVVGTGPWILTDYVDGSSMTYNKNPNYWGNDERYPQNEIPYMDTVKLLVIPDSPTSIAALRTGKVDFIQGMSWQEAGNLKKTNPELQQVQLPQNGFSVVMRCDKAPFTDIKVRKALQMSIDRTAIATSYYGGIIDGTPCGIITPLHSGYCYSYKDWPQSLKDEYGYNPDTAKKLLAEAGYPDGFKTQVVAISAGSRTDIQLLQAIKAYFMDIGVDMQIETMDDTTMVSYLAAGKHEQMAFLDETGFTFGPDGVITKRVTGNSANYTFNNDANYDAIVKKFQSAETSEDLANYSLQADKYLLENHWSINTFAIASYNVLSPDIQGYSGEPVGFVGAWGQGQILARLWISE